MEMAASKPSSPNVPEVPAIELRDATEADSDFLLSVYASTRAEELAATDWDETRKAEFCRMQSEAQDSHYQTHYPDAVLSVILLDGNLAGRLYVDRWTKEIRIMDITLLPHCRGRGVGTEILTNMQTEATATGKFLSIHVERFNPALSLYTRLGFVLTEDKGVYLLLHWNPAVT